MVPGASHVSSPRTRPVVELPGINLERLDISGHLFTVGEKPHLERTLTVCVRGATHDDEEVWFKRYRERSRVRPVEKYTPVRSRRAEPLGSWRISNFSTNRAETISTMPDRTDQGPGASGSDSSEQAHAGSPNTANSQLIIESNHIAALSHGDLATVVESQQPGRVGRCGRYRSVQIVAGSHEVTKADIHGHGATCERPFGGSGRLAFGIGVQAVAIVGNAVGHGDQSISGLAAKRDF